MAERPPYTNRLLTSFPAADLDRLRPHLEPISYKLYDPLIKPNETISHVVFPETCLASLVTILEDGSSVEGGSVGREGMAGVPAILDAKTTPMQTLIQVAGDATRVESRIMREVYAASPRVQTLVNRYVHTLFVIAAQSAACNRKHLVVARLARWLLMSSDGIGRDDVGITHEFLATMLGVRRSGVTEAAQALQAQGLIEYKRGGVRILDRAGLERAACECYRIVKNEYHRMFA
jgi:CRP-like cAMP-binding protein